MIVGEGRGGAMKDHQIKQRTISFIRTGFELWSQRKKRNYSVHDMARKIQISAHRYRILERGEDLPNPEEKEKITELLQGKDF